MFGMRTKSFLAPAPPSANSADPSAGVPLLEVRRIDKTFSSGGLFTPRREVVAALDVSFQVRRGEAVALVGESGSGKSTLARMVLRLERPDSGEVLLDGEDVLTREPRRASLAYRGRVQMVFQDPFSSLNPVHTVEHHLVRPLLRHGRALNPSRDVQHHLVRPLLRHRRVATGEVRARAVELLRTVGLEPAEEFMRRHPYELSGGQRQRVAIARALAVEPDLLVADEPTSMLDVSIRTGVLNLLVQLKRERGLAILLITHDLASARYLADRILVLFRGRVVEEGPSGDVVREPMHPYTRALLASIADVGRTGPVAKRNPATAGDGAGPGCPFVSRCPEALEVCRSIEPGPRPAGSRSVRCHLFPEGAAAPGS
jgi:peptide/nickel transport system ATP-binding protein